MAILTTDILTKLSILTGTAGNSLAQASAAASIGKYISTTAWTGGTLHDLFDRVTGNQALVGDNSYRCIFIHNAHATLTYYTCVVWLSAEVTGGSSISIGVDTVAASAIGGSSAQALIVATNKTAPVGVSFTSPIIKGDGIAVGDIPAGYCKAIWIKRTTAAETAAKTEDGCTLTISGDTEA